VLLGFLATSPAAAQSARDDASPASGVAAASSATAGAARTELAVLRDEIAELRREVEALTAVVRVLRPALAGGRVATPAPLGALPPAAAIPPPAALPSTATTPTIPTPAAFDDGSQPPSADSPPPVRLTGRIVSSSAYNSSDANWIDAPNLVGLASGGSLTSTLRQSRLAVEVGRTAVGSWVGSGALEIDFFGGTPGFATGTVMGLPRLLRAFGRFDRGRTTVLVGQEDVQLAPRDPTSLAALAFPQFFRSGNLFLRAPQIRIERRFGDAWTVGGGVVAPVAGDAGPAFVFAAPPGGGERSQLPAFESRVQYSRGSADTDAEAQIGVAGHTGWIRQGGQRIVASGAAVDVNLRRGRVALAGELFAADELDAFGAGLGQPGRAAGGWLEARFSVAPRVSINGGTAVDDRPDGAGTAGRLRNLSAFGNAIVRLTPAVSTSIEYRWLQTRYASGRDRPNHHVNAVLVLAF
jgi:hypothetical protein